LFIKNEFLHFIEINHFNIKNQSLIFDNFNRIGLSSFPFWSHSYKQPYAQDEKF